VKAEPIGGERDGDFMDNFIILDVVNIGRGFTYYAWLGTLIHRAGQSATMK
jgi:hypothetical protein